MIDPSIHVMAALKAHLLVEGEEGLERIRKELIIVDQSQTSLSKIETALSWMVEVVYKGSLETMQDILNYGLAATYSRQITANVERKTTSTGPQLVITVDDGQAKRLPPISSHGGGVVAIMDFLIRLSAILASGQRRLLVLDESFSAVSEDVQGPLSILIRELVEKLSFQIILITHQEGLSESADIAHKITDQGQIEQIVSEQV